MKKIVKVLGIILFSAFILLPLKTKAQEPVWTQELDLNDSVSSAIAKVEDGVVVMQYEGTASASNLLIKYDFNGNKIWEIDNDYGYNIESVSDGFIVWSENKITQFDKDKNILWSTDIEYKDSYTGGLGNKLVELNDGYVIGQTTFNSNPKKDFFKIDLQGNIVIRVSSTDLINQIYGPSNCTYIFALGKSLDGNSLIIVGRNIWTGIDELNVSILSSDLATDSTYRNSLLDYDSNVRGLLSDGNLFNDVIETDNGYILAGRKTFTFNKDGKFSKIHNKILLDITKIDDNLYGYLIEQVKNSDYNYKTSVVKYDQNLKEISRITLPFLFSSNGDITSNGAVTGFSQIKNRTVFYNKDGSINFTTLNTPINWMYRYASNSYITKNKLSSDYSIEKYELINYRLETDEANTDNDDKPTDSGIINSIIKNPQTNSILIVAVFVILILAISIGSYFIYKKKSKK